jgi:DNA-binding transcriptional LysR family regulator
MHSPPPKANGSADDGSGEDPVAAPVLLGRLSLTRENSGSRRTVRDPTGELRPLDNIDLKLVTVMNELYKTRSVSHTATNLDLTKSVVNMSLVRLRENFRDPLFVRTSKGMEPTPKAEALVGILKKAENLLQMALGYDTEFNPAVSDRVFHVCMRDIGQIRLLPRLIKRLREVAPSVRFETRNISDETPKLLESGEVDLAVGFIPPMGAGFCQQTLYKDRYICAVSANHPRIQTELTLQQFQEELHLVVSTSGTGHLAVESAMMARGIRRKIGLRLTSFLGMDSIIANTDFVGLLPEQVALMMASSGKIRLFPVPFSSPAYRVTQNWHQRYRHDPANRWLRHIMADMFMAKRTRRKEKG